METETRTEGGAAEAVQDELHAALRRMLGSLVFRGTPPSPVSDLSLAQMKCLFAVHDEEDLRMADVAARLEVKLPAASQTVDRLVRRGLLERRADAQDRRVVRLAVSEVGRGMVREARAFRAGRIRAATSLLNEEEAARVTAALHLLAETAERAAAMQRAAAITDEAPALDPLPLVEPQPLAAL
jgi:DNA-binding MarR family transcriptional regulator